ncbi:dTDP-4-amino-4,6-dideoxyglucose formyltransferase [Vibrio sp. Vb2131]|uniref:dTDP-4-amino-4,6-dideoxyglucose formyltransferase n=1 Tax=Vibrio sp. Vb2131 TaxID=3074649 RepID=UPI0029644614|nr:dTDP-4-amino-4,6-dideoxyglucose formyltransferase [Vibrio sp. Vb2131]MDW1886844.1 dTDP-4-amino-4,6-dideoxyglucose formyltransferase [Vibrio sp. Vb2131]
MKVAVITDNPGIYQSFAEIAQKHDLKGVVYSYYCNEQSKKLFSDDVQILDVKSNYTFLIYNYDLVVSCHCKKIFPKQLVNSVRCINIHPGLNPFNRGWFPQVFAINNGMPHGATIHEMDEEIDHGKIIAQKEVTIYESDTSKSVYDRVVTAEVELLDLHFEEIIKNNYVARPMLNEGNYNSMEDFRNLCKIDMQRVGTFKEFYNLLRSLTHPPYSNAYFINDEGHRVKISIETSEEDK